MPTASPSTPNATWSRRRLTPGQILLILLLLAGLVAGGWAAFQLVASQRHAARVRLATQRVVDGIRAERAQLESAIEAYRRAFGHYPPDHVLSRQPLVVDAVTNQLFYEISGTVFNPAGRCFECERCTAVSGPTLAAYFQVERFSNVVTAPAVARSFLPATDVFIGELTEKIPGLKTFGYAPLPEEVDPETANEFVISPWRYVTTQPTNNPGRFDLWIEVDVNNQHLVVGNWKRVE
jgi:hypothetical protein